MATTTNYGWTTPDNTALVKDGASAIRTLGSSVDTTVKALSPGTTAGDVDYYTSATAKARLAIGSTGQVLTVAGGVPSWATASSGGMTSLASGTLSGASVVISAISGSYKDLVLVVRQRLQATANQAAGMRLNGDSGNNYYNSNIYYNDTSAGIGTPAINFIRTGGDVATSGTSRGLEIIRIYDYANTSTFKICDVNSFTTGTTPSIKNQIGFYASASAITSVTILAESGNLTSGSYVLYGVS